MVDIVTVLAVFSAIGWVALFVRVIVKAGG